jgi:hypothetical protein
MREQVQQTLSATNPQKLTEIEKRYNNLGTGGGKPIPKGFRQNMRLMQVALIRHYLPTMHEITRQRAENTLRMIGGRCE